MNRHPLAAVLASSLVAAAVFGFYQSHQASVLAGQISAAEQKVKDREARIADLHSQITTLAGKEKSLESDVQYWKDQYQSQTQVYGDLSGKYAQLEQDLGALKDQNSQLVGENTSLKSSRTLLQQQAEAEKAKRESAETNLAAAPKLPYTMIHDRQVKWVFKDSKDNLYNWQLPIDTYKQVIESKQPQDMLTLRKSDGSTITVRDHTKFVDDWSFRKVVDEVYANSKSDEDFVYELWYITSQMTTYSVDIGEQPRWALETFTEAGGDCEDLAIVIASMIKSSSHTKDWQVQMVFFDLDHPHKAADVNHVALYVKTDKFSSFIETTDKNNGLTFWHGTIDGWYFDV
jgi:regulator of replication initiation timing